MIDNVSLCIISHGFQEQIQDFFQAVAIFRGGGLGPIS